MKNFNFLFNQSVEKLAYTIFKKTKIGNLKVVFPSGKVIFFVGINKGIIADIKINNFSMFGKFLKKGSIGFAESYMDGDFTTNNLKNLLILAEENKNYYINNKDESWIYKYLNKINHYLKQNTISKSQKNISYHYDLGNKFYELWLDETMTYSSGIFKFKYDDLSTAQINKYNNIIEPMQLSDKSSLLEIGCGWGGFSTYVAKNIGSKVTAITNSKEQFEYASKKVNKEGLNEKVNIQLKDYRDINNKYDNITSIEMFEAVGIKYWPVYFAKINDSLNKNGIGTFQIITINENKREKYQKNPDFIQQYIFPGGVLPSKKQLYQITSSIGLNFDELNSFGKSYANTLSLWNKKFQNAWSQIAEQGYTLRFKRMWEYYFSYCEAGFTTKSTDVSQFILKQ